MPCAYCYGPSPYYEEPHWDCSSCGESEVTKGMKCTKCGKMAGQYPPTPYTIGYCNLCRCCPKCCYRMGGHAPVLENRIWDKTFKQVLNEKQAKADKEARTRIITAPLPKDYNKPAVNTRRNRTG